MAVHETTNPKIGIDKIAARVKCTYAELYLADGTKIFSMQGKSLQANIGDDYPFLVSGLKMIKPDNRREQELVEVQLTKAAYNYLCSCIENAIKYFGGIGENYAKIVNYLFIRNINGNLERSYRPVNFYIPAVALRYYNLSLVSDGENIPGGSTEQDTIISNYEKWQEEQNKWQEEQDRLKQEQDALRAKRNKLLLLLSGVALLFKFS